MSNKISNPFLKQLISGISKKATEGRINNISWGTLSEAKAEAAKKSGDEDIGDILGDEGGGAQKPATGGADAAAQPADGAAQPTAGDEAGATGEDPLAGADVTGEDPTATAGGDEGGGEENPEQAQADAVKAKAELEKAKAEKDQAEKELENQSYIKLKSSSGTRFLLGKILNQAFKTNTIDALAAEMVQKLNVKTQADIASFSQDVAAFKVLPGMPELLDSMKSMAEKQPEAAASDESVG